MGYNVDSDFFLYLLASLRVYTSEFQPLLQTAITQNKKK